MSDATKWYDAATGREVEPEFELTSKDELARLRSTVTEQAAQIERLERERDTLIAKWKLEEWTACRPEGTTPAYGFMNRDGSIRFFHDRTEAVRFAAGLGEEGANG